MFQDDLTPAPRHCGGTATLSPPTLRIVTFPAASVAKPAPGYREIVAGLAAEVAALPATAVIGLHPALPALPALRAALTDARWLVGKQPAELACALAALATTLDLLTDGVLLPPERLGGDFCAVLAAIQAAPPTKSLALGYSLKHLVGVIGAVSGKLLAAGRALPADVPAPVVAEVSAPVVAEVPTPVVAEVPAPVVAEVPAPVPAPVDVADAADMATDRRFADVLIGGTMLVGVAVSGVMATLAVPEHAVAAGLVGLALATGWLVCRGR
jgi:hypothetical protein